MSIMEIETTKEDLIEEEKCLQKEIAELSLNTLIKIELEEERNR